MDQSPDRAAHWERVYRTKQLDEVSWYQSDAALSLQLIGEVAPDLSASILDVGAGASPLVEGLLASGYSAITLLDISPAALALTAERLGEASSRVRMIVGDIVTCKLPAMAYDVWHDRAAFHFLTDPGDRSGYVQQVRRALRPGGHLVVAAFAEDGPSRCSGLNTTQYSPESLHAALGAGFQFRKGHRELHETPSGSSQLFTYAVYRHAP